jgi:CRP/FNR family cyclic AMP-dependent transcriptional regulator
MTSIQILEKVDIFSDLNQEQLTLILDICREVVYFQGETIFPENSPSTEFYVILEGEIAIQVNPDLVSKVQEHHKPGTIAVLYPGQSFGEIALVDQGLRSASAVCNTMYCKALSIRREDLMNLLEIDPKMGFIVMSNLARDLCFKIRLSNLNWREALLYMPRQES